MSMISFCILSGLFIQVNAQQIVPTTLDSIKAPIRVDGKKRSMRLPLKDASQHGISYAHFQAAPAEDNPGIYVEWVKAEADD